jgi:hypothetical protein
LKTSWSVSGSGPADTSNSSNSSGAMPSPVAVQTILVTTSVTGWPNASNGSSGAALVIS